MCKYQSLYVIQCGVFKLDLCVLKIHQLMIFMVLYDISYKRACVCLQVLATE